MKRSIVTFAAVATAVLATSCSRFDPAEQAVRMTEKMADIFDADKNDCDKMGADLDAYIKDNESTFRKINAVQAKQTPEEKKAFQEKYKPRLEAAVRRMQAGIMACATNAKVQSAMRNIPK